jgi:hypothetical protein
MTVMQMNQNAADAFKRVMLARFGFLVDASDEFLDALRIALYDWIGTIDNEIASRAIKRHAAEQNGEACQEEGE